MKSTQDIVLDLAYSALLRRVLRILREAGIPVMPLKGVLLAYWLYENPASRLGGDIDLLVPEESFSKALGALSEHGFQWKFSSLSGRECTLTVGNPRIEVDLHRALFARGRFRVNTRDLFARGNEDQSLYSGKVVLPDPYDVYAHLIGHAASDHVAKLSARTKMDLSLIVERFHLNPKVCADRLDALGLGRAARYIFGVSGALDPFSEAVSASLQKDRLGDVLARLTRSLTTHFPPSSLVCRCAGFLINSSLPSSVFAIFIVLLNEVRSRMGFWPI
jgi:hypothetical protein